MGTDMPNPKNSAAPPDGAQQHSSAPGDPRGRDTWLGPPTQACGASLGRCLQAKRSSDARPLWRPRVLLLEPPGVHGDPAKGYSRATSPKAAHGHRESLSRSEACLWPATRNPMASDFLSSSVSCWVTPGDNSRGCCQACSPRPVLLKERTFLKKE